MLLFIFYIKTKFFKLITHSYYDSDSLNSYATHDCFFFLFCMEITNIKEGFILLCNKHIYEYR